MALVGASRGERGTAWFRTRGIVPAATLLTAGILGEVVANLVLVDQYIEISTKDVLFYVIQGAQFLICSAAAVATYRGFTSSASTSKLFKIIFGAMLTIFYLNVMTDCVGFFAHYHEITKIDAGAKPADAYALTDEAAVFQGVIVSGAPRNLAAFLRRHPLTKALVLSSPGGQLEAAREVGKIITEHHLATFVPAGAICASACALDFVMGHPHVVSPTGTIGLHSASYVDNGTSEPEQVIQQYWDALKRAGVSDKALGIGQSTPSASIHEFSGSAATESGIADHQSGMLGFMIETVGRSAVQELVTGFINADDRTPAEKAAYVTAMMAAIDANPMLEKLIDPDALLMRRAAESPAEPSRP